MLKFYRINRQTDRQIDGRTDRRTDRQSTDGVGRPNVAEFVDFWRKRFSVQLQRCNSRVILKKLSAFDITDTCNEYSTQYFRH